MSVRDVDHQHVGAGPEHLGGALEVVAGRANRGADAQPALRSRVANGSCFCLIRSFAVMRPPGGRRGQRAAAS